MSFNRKLSDAVRAFAGDHSSGDKIEFQNARNGRIVCYINGSGSIGATAEEAFEKSLRAWNRDVELTLVRSAKRRPVAHNRKRSSRRRTSRKRG